MPTQKIITTVERVIPSKRSAIQDFEVGRGGVASLYCEGFTPRLLISAAQRERILAILLESIDTDEDLVGATIEDQEVSADLSEEMPR